MYKFSITLFICLLFISNLITAQTNPNQPNILLIIADDLGVDASNGYQNSEILPNTPNLDALRASGLTFKNAWASPVCTPTRANIMSGKYGIKTGVLGVPGVLETTHTSIFKEIATQTNNTYADALIGKWHLSGPSTDYTLPSQHGVGYYEGSFKGGITDYYNWQKVSNETASTETAYATTYYTNKAIDWIGIQNQPWLLWLAHNAPHTPLHVPPSDLYTTTNTNNNQGKYIAMIEAMDAEIGRLFSSMSPDVLANTIIIYIGDNGTPNGVLQNFPNRHGKGSLYQGGIHVPMIVAGAGVNRQNEEEEAMVHATDIYATILELAGTELPGGIHNSLSFKHLLDNTDGAKRSYNYAEVADDWTIRDSQYKLIQLADGTQEFYDLIQDPLEEDNLINNLTTAQATIKTDFEMEGVQIRTGWSCNDFILNGDEITIDVIDNDNDGYISKIDCDDNNAAINPNAIEIPNNGVDENCDGADEMTTSISTCPTPTQITTELSSSRKAVISWAAEEGIDRYFVQIRVKGNTNWVTSTSAFDNQVFVYAPSNTYEIQIQANCIDGETSNFSNPYEFTISSSSLTDIATSTNDNNTTAKIVITELQINAAQNNAIAEKFLIFPNPASDLIVLQTKVILQNDIEVRLFDINGKQVAKKQLLKGSNTNTIDMQTLINGSYILEIREKNNSSQHKVIIMKSN